MFIHVNLKLFPIRTRGFSEMWLVKTIAMNFIIKIRGNELTLALMIRFFFTATNIKEIVSGRKVTISSIFIAFWTKQITKSRTQKVATLPVEKWKGTASFRWRCLLSGDGHKDSLTSLSEVFCLKDSSVTLLFFLKVTFILFCT